MSDFGLATPQKDSNRPEIGQLAPLPKEKYSVQVSPWLLDDINEALDGYDEDYLNTLQSALEGSVAGNTVLDLTPQLKATLAVIVQHPPLDLEAKPQLASSVLQDDGQLAKRIRRAMEVPSLVPDATVTASDTRKRAKNKDHAPRRRKRGSLGLRKAGSGDKGALPKAAAVVSSRVEFERTLAPLHTAVLQKVVAQLDRLKEAKEKVYCALTARAPDGALLDVDGRYYMLRKVVPHQHKPERAGDPSPRCMACALRIMYDRAAAIFRARAAAVSTQAEPEEQMTEEDVNKVVAKVIEDTIGISFKFDEV